MYSEVMKYKSCVFEKNIFIESCIQDMDFKTWEDMFENPPPQFTEVRDWKNFVIFLMWDNI